MKDQLLQDLKDAMKSKDTLRKNISVTSKDDTELLCLELQYCK